MAACTGQVHEPPHPTCNAAHHSIKHHPRQEFPLLLPTRLCLHLPGGFLNPTGKKGLNVDEDGIRTPDSIWEHSFVTETEQKVRPPDFHFLSLEWNLVLVIQAGD